MDKDTSETMVPKNYRDSRYSKEHHGHSSQTSGSASPKELSHIASRNNEEHVDAVQRDGGRQTGSRMSELKLGSGHIYLSHPFTSETVRKYV